MRSVFVALFALGISVCHATWSQWGNDAQNLWRASGTKTPLDLNIQWVKQMPYQSAPLVVDPAGNWYVAAQAYQPNVGNVDRIECYGTDGLRRWNSTQTFSYNSLSGVQPALSPDSKSLYVFSQCMLYSIDANTGKLNWAFSMDTCSGNIVPGIIGVDSEGTIFIRNGSRLLGVDPNTIGLAVEYHSNPVSNYGFNSRMATGQGFVAWLQNGQQFTAFDKKSGKVVWTANITNTDPTRVYLDMPVLMVPDQKLVLVTSAQIYRGDNYNTSVNAYDLTTGQQVWQCVMSSLRGSNFLAPFALSQDGQSVWALYYQGQYRYMGMLDLKTHTLKDFAEHDLSSAQPRLIVDPSGDVIYTMDSKVLQMAADQSFSRNYTVNQSTALATQYQFNQPLVLAVSDGAMFVGYGYSHNVVVRFSATGTKPSAPTFTSADPAVYAITIRFELPVYPTGTGGLVLTDLIVQYSEDGVNWVTFPISAYDRLSHTHCIQVQQLKAATKYTFRAAVLNTAGQGDWGTYTTTTVSDTNLCPALVYFHLPADNQPGVIDGVQPTTPSMAVIAPAKNPGGQPSYPGPEYAVSFQASNVSCRVCQYFTSKFNMYVASNGSGIGIRYWFQVDFTSDGVWDVDQLYPVPSTGHFYYPLPADGSWQHMGEGFNFTSDFNRGTIRVTVWNVIGGFESAISFGQSGVFSQANFNFWSKTTVLPC